MDEDKVLPYSLGAFYQEQDPDDAQSVYIVLYKYLPGLPIPAAVTLHYERATNLFTSIDPQDSDEEMLFRGMQALGFIS